MLSSEEGEHHISPNSLTLRKELALLQSLNFDKETEWLKQLYRSKLKKYHPETKVSNTSLSS